MTHSIPNPFSPNSHVRHSHYLHPGPLPADTLLSAPRDTGFKASLRKIPSALFYKEKTPVKEKSARRLQGHGEASISHPQPMATRGSQAPTISTGTITAAAVDTNTKVKKAKPRKALADIFGWGNHSSFHPAPAAPTAKPISPAAPAVPVKDTAMLKKLNRPSASRGSSHTSHPTSAPAQAQAGLRAPAEPVASRASMSDDPFGRPEEGAQVVEQVLRHGTPSVRSATPMSLESGGGRRGSVVSGKAVSCKTVGSDVQSVLEAREVRESIEKPQVVETIRETIRVETRRVSAPLPAHIIHSDLPPRSASLGKLLGSSIQQNHLLELAEVPAEASDEPAPVPGPRVVEVKNTLKKEKTKSKVWGLLGRSKSKKSKLPVEAEEVPPVPVLKESWARPTVMAQGSASLSTQIDEKYAAATARSNFSSMRSGSTRPRPPVLHLTAPSVDDPSALPQPSASTLSKSSTPNLVDSAHTAGSGGVWESVLGSTSDRSSGDGPRSAIEALMGPARLPKRKSLTGLFGLASKRSMDRVKPAATQGQGLPKEKAHASHGHGIGGFFRMPGSPPRITCEPTLRSLAEEIEEASEPATTVAAGGSGRGSGMVKVVDGDVFASRFGFAPFGAEPEQAVAVKRDACLRRVASATDKLLNLVTDFNFSPASGNSPTLRLMTSNNSLRQGFNGSPTPLRKVRSAMLGNKASGSSLRLPTSAGVSPLKMALHRKQAMQKGEGEVEMLGEKNKGKGKAAEAESPPRQSMVRQGMRNIFAPPSPVVPKPGKPSVSASPTVSAAKVTDELVGMGQTMGPTVLRERTISNVKGSQASDVPPDLKAMIVNTDGAKSTNAPSPNKRATLGLPAPPPKDRVSPRRPGPAPPALSLPPVPDVGTAHMSTSPEMFLAGGHDARDSLFSDMLTSGSAELALGGELRGEFRNSFDFTSEYAALDQGTQRASFVEALRKVGSVGMFGVGMGLAGEERGEGEAEGSSPTEHVPSFHISKPSDSKTLSDDEDALSDDDEDYEDDGDDEAYEDAVVHHVVGIAKTSPVRREPFKGQVAFQQHMTMRQQPSHASFGAPEPAHRAQLELPPLPALPPPSASGAVPQRGHRRGESSVATMSSIGSVIGTGEEREYTNYFDYTTAQHGRSHSRGHSHSRSHSRSHARHQSVGDPVEEVLDEYSPRRSPSHDSMASFKFGASLAGRPTTRRGHHHRNSSIASVDSVGGADLAALIGSGPPVSMHNNRRSSYISKHRRNTSSQSSFGRPDWAAHRRNSSSASTASNLSISQNVRPGLGDRMFQLDGGVKLTSITGSPPDGSKNGVSTVTGAEAGHNRTVSWDSLFDATHSKVVDDSLFDDVVGRSLGVNDSLFACASGTESSRESSRASTDTDSLFGPENQSGKKNFFLRGLRPISTISTETSASVADDTFADINVNAHVARRVEEYERCLQAEGEDMSSMTPLGKKTMQTVVGRQMLGSSMSRPAKPNRRRPAQLVFAEPPLDTPGLTSPSASETSSRLSLDTNAASFTLGTRTRPRGAGHNGGKSSAQVNIDSTIHEMPSMATLRPKKSSNSPRPVSVASHTTAREPTIVGVDGLETDEEVDRMHSVRNWVQWEREAVDEFRKTRNGWVDSEESKMAISDWKMPTTSDEIAAFLAQSSQAYKPLDQLPMGRTAHRRKSSLSDARALCSPYGLPLPKPAPINKPKMSLTTKYEKKMSTGSKASSTPSAFHFAFFPDDVPEAPTEPALPTPAPASAVFARFARETPASPPPTLAPFKPVSPFQFPVLDAFGLRKQLKEDKAKKLGKAVVGSEDKENAGGRTKRARVDSKARRQALGWGRRRDSDGPEKTVGMGAVDKPGPTSKQQPVVPAVPLQPKSTAGQVQMKGAVGGGAAAKPKGKMSVFMDETFTRSTASKGQENVMGTSQLQPRARANKSPVKRRAGPRQVASQPLGLRA